jgi:hypothetical protein
LPMFSTCTAASRAAFLNCQTESTGFIFKLDPFYIIHACLITIQEDDSKRKKESNRVYRREMLH